MEQKRQLNENGQAEPQTLPPPTTLDHKNANQGPPSYQHPPSFNPNSNVGKISDYEPGAGMGASPYSSRNSQTLIYSSDQGGAVTNVGQSQHIGSVLDMDPVNHNYGSLGRVYRAMYDYEAQDVDEVSFVDGDLIINVSSLDGGWMTGQVKRTGQVGMLPANYVQLATI